MKILQEVKDSIYNPAYYKALPERESLSQAVKYLAKLCLLASLLTLVLLSFSIPRFYNDAKETIQALAASYPDDLVVSVQNGVASINQPEPYTIPIKNDATAGKGYFKEDYFKQNEYMEEYAENSGNKYNNFVVIDTPTPFSAPKFKEYSSFAWLTETEIVVMKNNRGEIQVLPLAQIAEGNWEITKSWIKDKEAFLLDKLPLAIPILLPIIYFGIFAAYFVGNLVIIFLYAFVIWLMAKVKQTELSYKNSYKIGIHATTLLLILSSLVYTLGLANNFFFELVLIMVVVYVNIFKDVREEAQIEEK